MKYSLVTFRSVTPAQQAENHLRKRGVDCSLRRTPKWMEEQGCGYSIRIPFKDVQVCVDWMREAGIRFRKIYLMRDNGTVEEMVL